MRPRFAESGQATVELALLLPLVLLLTMALLQFGLVVRDAVALTGAARAGARRAVVDPSAPSVRAAAVAETGLVAERLAVSVGGDRSSGGLVVVTLRYRSPTEVPLVGRLLGDVVLDERLVARRE